MPGGTSRRIYSPMTQNEVIDLLRSGLVPEPFVRRMRLINLISASILQKIENDLFAPWTVLNISTALNDQVSQDYIITTIRNEPLQFSLWHGNVKPLWNISTAYPKLRQSFYSGWIQRFFQTPFDPLCIMLSIRAKALLDILDELGHSYNLMRALGFGFIDLGEIPGEEPGDPGDYYPPEIDNPIDIPDDITDPTPDPGPGDPGYSEPDPEIMPGDTGYVEPSQGDMGYVEPVPLPGDDYHIDPSVSDPGYIEALPGDGGPEGNVAGGINSDAPWNLSLAPGSFGGPVRTSKVSAVSPGDPCARKDDPEETVNISYTTLGMQVDEIQILSVSGADLKFSGSYYSWIISSGGGTLSSDTGHNVTYTSPSDNPECVNSPTIQLWCGGKLMDTISIAVNALVGNEYAYAVPLIMSSDECECGAGYNCCCYIEAWNVFRCDGLFSYYDDEVFEDCGCTGTWDHEWDMCDVGAPCFCVSEDNVDLRSAAKITAGCCPEGLL